MTDGMGFAGLVCEKQPATGSRGMVVTNHPRASAAGAEMLLAGGNAIDAAVASLFALTVAEPMMVGILGGGLSHIRLADGRHLVLDGISTAPAAARPDMFRPISDTPPDTQETEGRKNAVGPLAMAVPSALAAWCEALSRFGTMTLEEVLQPAIRLAARGFTATHYLADCVVDCAADLAADPTLAEVLLPNGAPIAAGDVVRQPLYAATLTAIAAEGPGLLYGGRLGRALAAHMAATGGLITEADLAGVRVLTREPVRGTYRGYEIVGPPPPSSAGVHVTQMLNLLEGFDIGGMGFDHPDAAHLLAEVLKIAFADRSAATADPDFVRVPVDRLISKDYAGERRAGIRMDAAGAYAAGVKAGESADTTHLTVADREGNVVAATQTLNGVFGARFTVPGTGMIANNYMFNFEPRPGHALSIEPNKRVFTSMAPMMALRDGRVAFALGLPGALRIFPSAMQALVNLIDHRMTLQQAVEAPRVFTQGHVLELEPGISTAVGEALAARGHAVQRVRRIAGGMNGIAFSPDGMMTGAACWRADGFPVGISGGTARPGVRFTTI